MKRRDEAIGITDVIGESGGGRDRW